MQDDVDYTNHINCNNNDDKRFKIPDDQSQNCDFKDKDFYHFDNLRIIECIMIVLLIIIIDMSMRAFSFVSFFDYISEVVLVLTDF